MNYIECLSKFYPGTIVVCSGDITDYNAIEWVSGAAIPSKTILDDLIFQQVKIDKLLELSAACQIDITNGFTSMALGTLNKYDSGELDQLNLIGAVAATAPTPAMVGGYNTVYAVRPIINNVVETKVYVEHTHYQLRQVLSDGAIYKTNELLNFNNKRNLVNACTTIEQVAAITWTSIS